MDARMARKKKIDDNAVIGFIDPRPVRRAAAVGAVGLLGLILLYVAAASPPAHLGWLVFLIVMGAGSVWISWRMWEVTAVRIELTRKELREVGGRVIFAIDEVDRVDRGFFAFKPANGFLVKLKERNTRPRVYVPGLWWRSGKTVMVGGVTSRRHTKAIADLITILLSERDGTLPKGLK